MIDSYAVKFYNGQDWITFKIFAHDEKSQAIVCANYLHQWRDVQVVTTITHEVYYECKNAYY
jgi:hypothetical protein